MKLSVMERILVLNLLPKEGSFANLKLLRVTREALSFNEAENKALKFRQVGNQTMWESFVTIDKETGKPIEESPDLARRLKETPDVFETKPIVGEKEVFIGEIVSGLIAKALKEKNEKETLSEEFFSMYEKFVDRPEDFKTNPGKKKTKLKVV